MSPAGTRYPRIYLSFAGDTHDLLRPPRQRGPLVYPLTRRASLKDIIEGLGVPHTEVGRLLLEGLDQSFAKIPHDGEQYHIQPLTPDEPPTVPTFLRPAPLPACTFLVDINVGRLAGLLRMAGLDAAGVGLGTESDDLVQRAAGERRILLSRNRDLLKHRDLVFGRLVRSEKPDEQLQEIVDLYHLRDELRPFTRCIACNGLLVEVDKTKVIDRLLPLTKKYYDRFKECPGCGNIYWQGSHHGKMIEKLRRILPPQ